MLVVADPGVAHKDGQYRRHENKDELADVAPQVAQAQLACQVEGEVAQARCANCTGKERFKGCWTAISIFEAVFCSSDNALERQDNCVQ
jgi:hypothetical protein